MSSGGYPGTKQVVKVTQSGWAVWQEEIGGDSFFLYHWVRSSFLDFHAVLTFRLSSKDHFMLYLVFDNFGHAPPHL
jgi:hypothetical protein